MKYSTRYATLAATPAPGTVFVKETLVKGQPARIECVEIAGQIYSLTRGLTTVLRLEDEWFSEVRDPQAVIDAIRRRDVPTPDVFTFCQRLPNIEPRFDFPIEFESIAALPIQTYEHWWKKQIRDTARNKIRKSRKLGVDVRECAFDDEFVRGMTTIFNETPVRQGRRFWHYGKSFETVKQQFSRFLFREQVIGAYLKDRLVGFAMLGRTSAFADLGQILSLVEHRDKAVTNALLDKCVAICAEQRVPYLVYAYWLDTSLGLFKQHSGFEEIKLPRYVVPMTRRGHLAVRTNLHKGFRHVVPRGVAERLRRLRAAWYQVRDGR